ncbi:MAG: macro domain-containing protein [Spirulinaceae cyanobacterium]
MNRPKIELIPLRNAVSSETTTTLDLVVKIMPPEPDLHLQRPNLNLGLVIDRSGSMEGEKITYARQAACYAVEQLLATDRVSITIYDDRVETLVASTLAADKAYLLAQIQKIQPRSATALHAGWVEGGMQVGQHLQQQEQLNRVILLSDGLANRGETNPDVIASDVEGLAKRGISTSTMGVGLSYNEDLLQTMAQSGDGNYHYIESPEQLPAIFEMEMQGLVGTFGRRVRLAIEPQAGVQVADVLNDFAVTRKGKYKLPNLIKGNPFITVVRLTIPPQTEAQTLCSFRLGWDDLEEQRQKLKVALQLSVVNSAQLKEYPFNTEVQQQVAMMMSARAKEEAVQKVDQGDYEGASQLLQKSRGELLKAPASPLLAQEAQSCADLEQNLQNRQLKKYRKRASYESHQVRASSAQFAHGDYYTRRNAQTKSDRWRVIKGDITKQKVDAVVNPTDRYFCGGAVDAVIKQSGGKALQVEMKKLGEGKVGEAKITPGYNLPAQWIIHVVAPIWQGGGQDEEMNLAKCYESCLKLAEQHNIATIAFPCLGTGGGGFPKAKAAKIAVDAVVNFLARNSSLNPTLTQVTFVCYEQQDYDCYLKLVIPSP